MAELVLTKVDRASMANSLEVRIPFLDHELFEEVFAVRERTYFRSDMTKFLLHENIKGHIPDTILARPKQGFVGPETFYTNMSLYHAILDDSALASAGIIRDLYIRDLFSKSDCWRHMETRRAGEMVQALGFVKPASQGGHAFVFVVCGNRQFTQELNYSIAALRHVSKSRIIVVTDSTRNNQRIDSEQIIDVATPAALDDHQASIYLENQLAQVVTHWPPLLLLGFRYRRTSPPGRRSFSTSTRADNFCP